MLSVSSEFATFNGNLMSMKDISGAEERKPIHLVYSLLIQRKIRVESQFNLFNPSSYVLD